MVLVTDLPTDIVVLVFPYLKAPDFLSFTSCTRSFLAFRQDPAYWAGLTRSTFRVSGQPLLEDDGARWQRLYKNLATQTHVFTWGNNESGNLGHSIVPPAPPRDPRGVIRPRVRPSAQGIKVGWPKEMANMDHVGIVADVQCGGWSTVLLNSIGQLFAVGVLDGEHHGPSQLPAIEPKLLAFPPGYPVTSRDRYEPSTAIIQYSVGRSHVIALSDSGTVWEWSNITKHGYHIKSSLMELGDARSSDKIARVVAGWTGSSAYVKDTGIIYWSDTPKWHEAEEGTDGFLLNPWCIVGTSFRRVNPNRSSYTEHDIATGEVTNYVVLEHHVVFITHLNKIFAYPIAWPDPDPSIVPLELTTFYQESGKFHIQDIQGSFRNFGIFTKEGTVLVGNNDVLNGYFTTDSPHTDARCRPTIIPSLQRASVISLAFGDYHIHALHSNGTISSLGFEPQGCGALGLGPPRLSILRGIEYDRAWGGGDGRLVGTERRTIWFRDEMASWLRNMAEKSIEGEAQARGAMMRNAEPGFIQTYGEWFEREGRYWGYGPQGPTSEDSKKGDNHETGAYFALKVSAAGWHSGALMLVDQEKAENIRQKYLIRKELSPVPLNENVGGEEAEGEEISSPGEQLVETVSAIGTWLGDMGRWFLGLTERDAPTARPQLVIEESNEVDDSEYVWHLQQFPRLRLPDGQEMPGEIPLTPWKGTEPVLVVGETMPSVASVQ